MYVSMRMHLCNIAYACIYLSPILFVIYLEFSSSPVCLQMTDFWKYVTVHSPARRSKRASDKTRRPSVKCNSIYYNDYILCTLQIGCTSNNIGQLISYARLFISTHTLTLSRMDCMCVCVRVRVCACVYVFVVCVYVCVRVCLHIKP